MNHFISEIIPEFTLEKSKNACKDKVYIGIDFGTSTTVVSCCYWDEETDELKIEELNLDQLESNPPIKKDQQSDPTSINKIENLTPLDSTYLEKSNHPIKKQSIIYLVEKL